MESPYSPRLKKGETGEEHVYHLDIKGTVHKKNSSWQAKQSIPHTSVTFYGDCVKVCEDLSRTLATEELAVATRQRTVSQFLFHQEFLFIKTNMTVPHPPYVSLFPRFKIKLKGPILTQPR
jgi:hypothetical protein